MKHSCKGGRQSCVGSVLPSAILEDLLQVLPKLSDAKALRGTKRDPLDQLHIPLLKWASVSVQA